ncbi:MAG: hypothetical protein M1536_03530 [Firmicutes bacterium]|nr:hypothetical protein [Bacillota bacterium]
MTIYLDSAVKSEIESILNFSFVKGITTNPSIIASALKKDEVQWQEILDLISWISKVSPGEIFVQTNSDEYSEMYKEARYLSSLVPKRMVIKIPYSLNGLRTVASLKSEGIPTAVTAIFDPVQVYVSAEAGASYAIPYYNRMKKESLDVSKSIPEMLNICRNSGKTKLLAASIKTTQEVLELLNMGILNMTISFSLIEQIMTNELTRKSIEKFQESLKVKGL